METHKKYVKWVILWGILFWIPLIAGTSEQELPALVTFVTLFGIIAFTMNDKGHGKINNLFWGAFANFAGLIYVGARGYKKGSSAYKQKDKKEKERRNQLAKQHAKRKAAIRNAENNDKADIDLLFVKSIIVNQGMRLKRMKPRARGRADRIIKPTCHIEIILKEEDK